MRNFCLLLLKILNWWFLKIPIRFSILALLGYCGLFFLLFGTMNLPKVENILESIHLPKKSWMIIGGPMFISFVALFVGGKGSKNVSSLDKVVQFRNGQMGISSDKKASEILQKTSELDAMQNNKDSEVYNKAKRGFEARFGTSSPATAFKELMDK